MIAQLFLVSELLVNLDYKLSGVTNLNLDDWVKIAKIVTSVGSVLILAISTWIAYSIWKLQRDLARSSAISLHVEQMRHWNLLVLENTDLQEFESNHHSWGELSRNEVKKMYRFFILLNVLHSQFSAYQIKAIDENVYSSVLKNIANMTYSNSDFIEKNCFNRGYPDSFKNELRKAWEKTKITHNKELKSKWSSFYKVLLKQLER